jgi:hypothetical protein
MNLPMPNMRAVAMGFLALVFLASALTLLVWVALDWYEERDR